MATLKNFQFNLNKKINRDTFSLFRHPETLQKTIDIFTRYIEQLKPDVIVGLESRGFTFGNI